MTDSEFFEFRVKAFLLFCWQRKYVFLLLFLISAAGHLFRARVLAGGEISNDVSICKSRLRFVVAEFLFAQGRRYLPEDTYPGGWRRGWRKSDGRTFSADISEEDLATPDDFAKMVLNKAPKARIVAGVAEIQLITKDPNFVDKVFLPLIDISRQIVIDSARERQGRVDQIYAQLSKGNLSQKERETIEESRLNSHISTLARVPTQRARSIRASWRRMRSPRPRPSTG